MKKTLAKKELTQRRNNAIRKSYDKLQGKKKNGVKYYSHEFIVRELQSRFFLAIKTIEDIIACRDLNNNN